MKEQLETTLTRVREHLAAMSLTDSQVKALSDLKTKLEEALKVF